MSGYFMTDFAGNFNISVKLIYRIGSYGSRVAQEWFILLDWMFILPD